MNTRKGVARPSDDARAQGESLSEQEIKQRAATLPSWAENERRKTDNEQDNQP